jgi:hypothetical protein
VTIKQNVGPTVIGRISSTDYTVLRQEAKPLRWVVDCYRDSAEGAAAVRDRRRDAGVIARVVAPGAPVPDLSTEAW